MIETLLLTMIGDRMRAAILAWAEARVLAYIKSAAFEAEEVAVIENLKKRIDTELDILKAKVATVPVGK